MKGNLTDKGLGQWTEAQITPDLSTPHICQAPPPFTVPNSVNSDFWFPAWSYHRIWEVGGETFLSFATEQPG